MNRRWIGYAAMALILPHVAFYWLLPGMSFIGQDYIHYAILQQQELFFSVEHGTWPLYVPGFNVGHSAAALSLGQMFHPLAHIARLVPGYWNGGALAIITELRLFSLGVAHLAWFFMLRRWGIKSWWAAALGFAVVYNLRCIDLFRYAASLEAWTGFLFVTACWHAACAAPTKWRLAALIGSTYWLVSSGHHQMILYAMVGVAIVAALQTRPRTWTKPALAAALGFVAATPAWVPFYVEFVRHNSTRVAQGYAFSAAFGDTLAGTFQNFSLPLRADVHGAFGGNPLWLWAMFLPFFGRAPRWVWGAWVVCVLCLLHAMGELTPFHYWIWKFVPFASSLRVPGRVTMLIPILATFIAAWGLTKKEKTSVVVAGAASIVLAVVGFQAETTAYAATSIRKVSAIREAVALVIGLGCLGALLKKWPRVAAGCLVVQFTLLSGAATWRAPRHPSLTWEELSRFKKTDLQFGSFEGYGLHHQDVMHHLERAPNQVPLAVLYHRAQPAGSRDSVYRARAKGVAPNVALVEGLSAPLQPSAQAEGDIQLVDATHNALRFRVRTSESGLVSLAIPHGENWKAYVDDHSVRTYRQGGLQLAALVPTGESTLRFQHQSPSTRWSVVLAAVSLVLATLLLGLPLYGKAVGIVAAVALLGTFETKTTGGDPLPTTFTWRSPADFPAGNLAFGLPGRLSSLHGSANPQHFFAGRAVDGHRGTFAQTLVQEDPELLVDLGETKTVASIQAHIPREQSEAPCQQHSVLAGQTMQSIRTVPSTRKENVLETDNDTSFRARYIGVAAHEKCSLRVAELQAFESADGNPVGKD